MVIVFQNVYIFHLWILVISYLIFNKARCTKRNQFSLCATPYGFEEGRWFFNLDFSSPFCFLLIEFFIVLFPYLIKYYHIMFIIVFWLGRDRLSGLARFTSFYTHASLLTFFVCFFVVCHLFLLAVPMRECLGKHSRIRYTFPISILNGTCFFQMGQLQIHNVHNT